MLKRGVDAPFQHRGLLCPVSRVPLGYFVAITAPLLRERFDAFSGVTHWHSFTTGRNWQTETVPSEYRQNTVKFSPVESMTTIGSPPAAVHPRTKSFACDTPWLRGAAPAGIARPPRSSTATA